MKKMIALMLAVLLVISAVSICYAATCDREVKGKACGKTLSWVTSGQSVAYSATHKYGGFLGLFQSTCNYNYRYIYSHYQCTAGHVQNMRTSKYEYNHQCK